MIRDRRILPVLAAIARLAWVAARSLTTIVGRGMHSREGVVLILAALVVLSAWTAAVPALSKLLSGVAVLLLAGVGLWLIASVPLRRR